MADRLASLAAKVTGAGQKRESFSALMESWKHLDDAALSELMDEQLEFHESAIGFRFHSKSTQEQQDSHLKKYRQWISPFVKLDSNASEEEFYRVAFPEDHAELFKLLRMFLMRVFKHTPPRSKNSGERIQYGTLMTYRGSMMFWTYKIWRKRQSTPPERHQLFSEMTEAMRKAHATFGNPNSKKTVKSGLGAPEMRQLLDYEISTNWSIEVSEQHQAAWCIGRITAVRPGSIGPSRHRSTFLKWEDIEFVRGSEQGKFDVKIEFKTIKTNRDDPEHFMRHITSKCYIKSPSQQNIIFSVAHRLLTIALRRDILVGIDSVDSLLQCPLHVIKIKKEALQQPVFYRSTPRGLTLDMDGPMTSTGLSQYLALRGYHLGYHSRITFYSIRRQTATDLVRRIGLEKTREIMSHAPHTRTLERYYLNSRPFTDLTAAALGEPVGPHAYSEEMAENHAPLAHERLDSAKINYILASTLGYATARVIENDENYPVGADRQTIKQYKRRVRQAVLTALLEEEHALQKQQMTQVEWESRREAAKASSFAEAVMSRAQSLAADASSSVQEQVEYDELSTADDPEEEEFHGFDDDDEYEELEMDLDDAAEGQAEDSESTGPKSTTLNFEADEDQSADPDENANVEVEYVDAAKSFMEILIGNTLTTQTTYMRTTCPLCRADKTLDSKYDERTYPSAANLERHLQSQFHTPFAQWKRLQWSQNTNKHAWYCPYCKDSKRKDSKKYTTITAVVEHIKESNATTHGDKHDEFKTEDGWYDELTFFGTESTYNKKSREGDQRRTLARMGITYEPEPQLLGPIPHPTEPGILLGEFGENVIDDDLKDLVYECDPKDDPGYEVLRGVIALDRPPRNSYEPVPVRYQGSIIEMDGPPQKKQRRSG